jgi:hypothetical protein
MVFRRDVLERAWGQVRANRGAAGIDRITLADVEQYGITRLLDELAADLRDGRYRPLPARRVFIAKPGSQERRPLAIPAIRDRIVQAAAKTALRAILAELGLEPKQAKTGIVHLREGGEGLDFLGFQRRPVRSKSPRSRHVTFLARWPSRRAMQHARERIRALTARERLGQPVEEVVQD